VQPGSALLPVHRLRARLHHNREGDTAVPGALRERALRLREFNEQLRFRVAGGPGLFQDAGE